MISHIYASTVIVSDQDAALDFYVGKLGWEKRGDETMPDGYRFLTVAPPGAATELVLGAAHVYHAEPGAGIGRGDTGMGKHTGIVLAVEDVRETHRALVERGVHFTDPPAEMPWGDLGAWMADPDGNRFFLVGR